MNGYEVQIEELSQRATQLQDIIEQFQVQLQQIVATENDMLNDALWYGPNKVSFMNRLAEYKNQAEGLLNNAITYHTALQEIIQKYVIAES